jgi:hypothetical protein
MFKGILASIGASISHNSANNLERADLISEHEYKFFNFIATYGKTYGTKSEYNFRFQVFA